MIEPSPRLQDSSPRSDEIRLDLAIRDPELVRELIRQGGDDARRAYALQALRIGLQALKAVRGEVDAAQVRNEGDRILGILQERLQSHQHTVHERMESKLKEYFDPTQGRFTERVERLVKDDGELQRVMRGLVGAEDSELRKTLQAHLGEGSELMTLLSPTDSQGLLHSLGERLDGELSRQRETILREFTLDNTDGALSRLVRELKEQHGDLNEALKERVAGVVREFDLNEDDSALSKLVRRVESTQKQISDEFSLDRGESALARMQQELLKVLREHRSENTEFRARVMARLGEQKGAAEEAKRGTHHGLTFEAAAFQAIQERAQAAGDIATATGNTTGMIPNSKKGDIVIEFGPDSAAAGAKVVMEIKQEQGFRLDQARAELATATKNRGAQCGVFVYSRRTAPDGIAQFQRIGNDVYVVWDADDQVTDILLDAALAVSRALVMNQTSGRESNAADFEAVDKAINAIEKQAEGLDQIKTFANTITSSADKILDRVRKMGKNIERNVKRLREQTDDLRTSMESE